MNFINYNHCHFCRQPEQTVEHLFFECPHIRNFWTLLTRKFRHIFQSPITAYEAIIGAYDEDFELRLKKNTVLLHARMTIYEANNKETSLDLEKLVIKLQEHHELETSSSYSQRRNQEIEDLFDFMNYI